MAILQNLLDRGLGWHKNCGDMKKLWYFIVFFGIMYFGIRKIHYGWFGECVRLPNRGTAS